MWRVDMQSIVLCVRDCFSMLLDASYCSATDVHIDTKSNQPSCGWDVVDLIHSFSSKSGETSTILLLSSISPSATLLRRTGDSNPLSHLACTKTPQELQLQLVRLIDLWQPSLQSLANTQGARLTISVNNPTLPCSQQYA